MKVIQKKNWFESDQYRLNPNTIEAINLNKLFVNFFSKRNCTYLLQIMNKYSVVDALLTSGNSTVLIEYKERLNKSIADYDSILIEFDKWVNLKDTARLLNASSTLYINEFKDAIIIHSIDFEKGYKWYEKELPSNNSTFKNVIKTVADLMYNRSTYIIAKRTWIQASTDQLMRYIFLKKNQPN